MELKNQYRIGIIILIAVTLVVPFHAFENGLSKSNWGYDPWSHKEVYTAGSDIIILAGFALCVCLWIMVFILIMDYLEKRGIKSKSTSSYFTEERLIAFFVFVSFIISVIQYGLSYGVYRIIT